MAKRIKVYHVESLRSSEKIEEMKWAILRGNKGAPKRSALAVRDELLFLVGINTGLRVNDLEALYWD